MIQKMLEEAKLVLLSSNIAFRLMKNGESHGVSASILPGSIEQSSNHQFQKIKNRY
jgi:hypothetical protein